MTWTSVWGGAADERIHSITVDASGNIYVAGSFTSMSLTHNAAATGVTNTVSTGTVRTADGFIARLTYSGTTLSMTWVKGIGGTWDDFATGVTVDALGESLPYSLFVLVQIAPR